MPSIAELRAKLFETLDALNDRDKPLDIERAKVTAEVAQVIINSAKVEVEFMRVAGGKGSGFIVGEVIESPASPATAATETTEQPTSGFPNVSTSGIRSITQHVMKG